MPSWLDWFKLKRGSSKPICQQTEIGEICIESGTLLFGDPADFSSFVSIDGIPPGSYPVQALTIRYPAGFSRVAKVGIRFQPGDTESQRKIGGVGVDSGMVVAIDAKVYKSCWKEVGPGRIGVSSGKDFPKVTKLIEQRFGVKWEPRSICSAKSIQPISEQLEAEITAYLQTFPEYSEYTFIYFSIDTENSNDRVAASLHDCAWNELELDSDGDAALLAISAGYGDGCYDLYGIFQGDKLLGMECEFIGAEMDEALQDAPSLRY